MKRSEIGVIPVPKRINTTGKTVEINPCISCNTPEWKNLIDVTQKAFEKIFNVALEDGNGGIRIVFDKNADENAYCIKVENGIILSAGGIEGCGYGIASILQLLKVEYNAFLFPEVEIYDCPEKEHRGFMIDLARWWHPKRTILAYLDLCFYYKIKYMHLHFVDYQSYTLPSKAFPKLPTKNRHYSFAEIEEIREYARNRNITLIPEIEMPGHATPLNVEYPELFSDVTTDGFLQKFRSTASIVCAGSEQCFASLKKLIDEVIELFPESPYIHLGGDEATIEVWEHCDVCQQYMKAHNLHSVKELYSEFTARITDYVLSKNRIPIVWEGFPREAAHLISKDVIVMAWECYYNQPEDLLADGFKIINCAWKPLYICPGTTDWTYQDILRWNVYNMQNFSKKSRATLNPVNLPETQNVLGAQLCAWEACYEYEINYVANNMAAFSERMWSHQRICDDAEFDKKLAGIKSRALKLIQEI